MDDIQEIGLSTCNTPFSNTGIFSSCNVLGMLVTQSSISAGMLVLHGDSAPWVIEAAKKLEAIGKLPANWDSYQGIPLDMTAKKLTVNALGWLGGNDLPVPAVVLGSAGTVQLEWRTNNGRELEIELGNDRIEFVKIYPSGNVEEGEESGNLPTKLQGLTWWLLHG